MLVGFTLPDAAEATLELFAVSGRRVTGQAVGPLGAGHHVVNLARTADLTPGVYFLSLTRGQERRLSKTCVVR
jgi:hypothetical protein